jgi:hypothetical protein
MSKNISGEIEFDKMGTCITIIRSITNTNEHRKARESSGGKKRGMPDEQNIFPKLDAKKRERVLAGKSEECQTNETFPPN